ncbi:Uncharacterised protein [Chlamydia trachomatis]|nr:Uncharacterised protein [Chlamydia trachomatis]
MKLTKAITALCSIALVFSGSAVATADEQKTPVINRIENIPLSFNRITDNPSQIPAFAGGDLKGIKTSSVTIPNKGTVTVTINYETGTVIASNYDGTIKVFSGEELVSQLSNTMKNLDDEQRSYLLASAQSRISKSDVCPYLVSAIGTLHASTWQYALALVGVNPAIAVLVALGEGFFWTWVSTHC